MATQQNPEDREKDITHPQPESTEAKAEAFERKPDPVYPQHSTPEFDEARPGDHPEEHGAVDAQTVESPTVVREDGYEVDPDDDTDDEAKGPVGSFRTDHDSDRVEEYEKTDLAVRGDASADKADDLAAQQQSTLPAGPSDPGADVEGKLGDAGPHNENADNTEDDDVYIVYVFGLRYRVAPDFLARLDNEQLSRLGELEEEASGLKSDSAKSKRREAQEEILKAVASGTPLRLIPFSNDPRDVVGPAST